MKGAGGALHKIYDVGNVLLDDASPAALRGERAREKKGEISREKSTSRTRPVLGAKTSRTPDRRNFLSNFI